MICSLGIMRAGNGGTVIQVIRRLYGEVLGDEQMTAALKEYFCGIDADSLLEDDTFYIIKSKEWK